jgi:hypothetical protein
MRTPKKRKAARVYDDTEGEAGLPVRSTKEIAETHQTIKKGKVHPRIPNVMREIGENENGKELFDKVLKGMASPDSQ